MPGRHADRASRGRAHLRRSDQPRTVAPPAGLRPRRAHEDRDRRAEIVAGVRHSQTIGVADRDHHPQQGLEELDRNAAGRRRRWRRGQAEAALRGRVPATPIWPAPSSTISTTPVTSWNAPAPGRPRRASPSGALAKALLRRVRHRGSEPRHRRRRRASASARPTWDELVALQPEATKYCSAAWMPRPKQRMKDVVDQAYRTGDTVGGVFEVVARGVPPGLGSHITWDTRLDGRLAQAIVSMQAVKGVEIGFAAEGAASFGSPCRTRSTTTRAAARIHARRQPRGRPGRRNHQRPGSAGARAAEADLHSAASARIGGSGDARARARRLRAARRLRGAGRRRDRRGHGGARAGAGVPRKIRRRFARRDQAQLRRLSGTGGEF